MTKRWDIPDRRLRSADQAKRIIAALPLIKNTGMRAEEIAAQCGFKTVHAFKAALKKRTGKSIRAWRKP